MVYLNDFHLCYLGLWCIDFDLNQFQSCQRLLLQYNSPHQLRSTVLHYLHKHVILGIKTCGLNLDGILRFYCYICQKYTTCIPSMQYAKWCSKITVKEHQNHVNILQSCQASHVDAQLLVFI